MGITIDEAQSNLRNIQRYYIKVDNETIDFAIDIIRKYQKIEQILKDIPYGGDATVWRIQEVVEDGKID